jgi:hypothetical protein
MSEASTYHQCWHHEEPALHHEILGGGHHFKDVSQTECWAFERQAQQSLGGGLLPRDSLLMNVLDKGLKQLTPKGWLQTKAKK